MTDRLRSALVAVACAALVGGGGGSNAGTDARETLLDAVQQRYDGIRDVRAHFEQSSRVASLGRDQVSSGRVFVKRPGRMRWEYTDPAPSVIVVDGDAVRMYDPSERKLQILPLGPGTLSPTALGFLLGNSKLRDVFDVSSAPLDAAPAADGSVDLHLTPRRDSSFESLALRFERDTQRLRESLLVDLFGNRTRVRFDDVVENGGIEEEAFTIQVPEDTEVIDLR